MNIAKSVQQEDVKLYELSFLLEVEADLVRELLANKRYISAFVTFLWNHQNIFF